MQLEPILWSALVGWGLGETRTEISKLPLAYPDGRQTSWPEVVGGFCELHRGSSASEPYLVGRFLSFCVSNSLLDGSEQLQALNRELAEIRREGREKAAHRARRRMHVVKSGGAGDPQ